MSKGEEKISKIFNSYGIYYKREYTFSDLRGCKDSFLRFDFAIFDKNYKLKYCLDFDGRQHFQYVPHFHKTPSGFVRQKERDVKKNKYCLIHNIPLIRIPYWELDNLTLQKIFNTPEFVVKSKYHNLNLINKGVK